MIGFTPGFAYLGDLPNKLVMPRLSTPRINLLPGSVGISGNRTGVYTLGGPGGWRIIGRTPKSLFDPSKKNPFGISTGMRIKFKAITKRQYKNCINDLELSDYQKFFYKYLSYIILLICPFSFLSSITPVNQRRPSLP